MASDTVEVEASCQEQTGRTDEERDGDRDSAGVAEIEDDPKHPTFILTVDDLIDDQG